MIGGMDEKPVTGPDGDNPITDEQILELERLLDAEALHFVGDDRSALRAADARVMDCRYARGEIQASALSRTNAERLTVECRTICAAAYNARRSV